MIDNTTGRFCLAHSMQQLWATGNVEVALYGMPTRVEVAGQPLTDLLCPFHRWYFAYMPISLALRNADGTIKTHPRNDDVPVCEMIGKVVRPQGPTQHDLSRLDLLKMLERMECGLRLLDAERRAGFVHDETTQDTCTLDEVIERAKLHRDIEAFLNRPRTANDLPAPLTPPVTWKLADFDFDTNRDDPNDRISGEE